MATATAETAAGVKFVHLHNHTHYSLLDGLQKVPQMLDRAKALGMESMALTDHGTLSGAIEFYKEAKKRGIRPIIGSEVYVAPRSHKDKAGKADANPYHLILLAYNATGYHNLMKLVTVAHLEGFYYKPRVDRELLEQFSEGLICLSACASGEVARHILNDNFDQAVATIEWYKQIYGEQNYYLELQDHEEWPTQKLINAGLFKLAKTTNTPLVVTADCHYCEQGDREAHEVLLCVQTGKTMGDTDRMEMEMDLFVSEPLKIAERWKAHPEVLANTVKIAERCELELEFDQILIPQFAVPTGQTERDYLHQLAYQGLAWRYGGIPKEDIVHITPEKAKQVVPAVAVERLEFELGVIGKMAYEGYFLIVADFINWGKNQGIIFGPGRGSAAGSIVAYALNVTDLDPLKYDLLFERFLNPDRISMPDIDIDMQDTRREEVIAYVNEKYGEDRVAQIVTFGTMAARAAVRDTGRALGMPYAEVDAIAKLVPMPIQGRHIPLINSIEDDPDLKREYETNPRAKKLIDLASRLEGTIRSNGVHAAGVVIAPDDIVNYTPLQRAQKGGICTQYSMGPIEDLGLLKMDFLGLSNLTIIKNALRIVRRVHGQKIDIADIPLDDAKTYELLARGDTTGVFQLESAGMKRYLKALKPTEFNDIIAMVALYRPGPMQWIDDFIDRKHERKRIELLHPAMENALKDTYGVIVYQEQVMQIAKEMCGFTGGQADTLRKAIGKKIPSVMKKMKNEFIEGAIKTVGAERQLMEEFWAQLEDFAAYCFNKSHAACYGLIAYQTAYLKAHFPNAFMAALMTSDYHNIDRIAIEVAECKRMGITVLPPDVNESYLEFGIVPESGDIRFGLSAIKNVGTGGIEAILAAREEGGKFSGIEDFAKRVNASEVNKKVWESLIQAGAFDSIGDRGELSYNIDLLTSYASKAQKNALSGQIDIFGSMGVEDDLPALRLEIPKEKLTTRQQLAWEKELLGLYISSHPLDDYDAYLIDKSTPIGTISPALENQAVMVGGIVTTVRRIMTKNNEAMAFVGLEDKTGDLELIVFPKAFAKTLELWQPDQVLLVAGKVNTKDRDGKAGELKILVDKAKPVEYETVEHYQPKRKPVVAQSAPAAQSLVITIKDLANTTLLIQVKDLLSRSRGDSEAFLVVGPDAKKIRLPFKVEITPQLQAALANLVGESEVALV